MDSWAVLTVKKGFIYFSCCPASEGVGGSQGAGGTEPGQLTQTGQRHIPCHLASYWPIKLGVVSQQGCHCLGTAWILVSNCIVHHFFSFFLFFSFFFLFFFSFLFFLLIKLSLCQPTVSLTFTFFISFPHPTWGRRTVWYWSACWVKLQQHVFRSFQECSRKHFQIWEIYIYIYKKKTLQQRKQPNITVS